MSRILKSFFTPGIHPEGMIVTFLNSTFRLRRHVIFVMRPRSRRCRRSHIDVQRLCAPSVDLVTTAHRLI